MLERLDKKSIELTEKEKRKHEYLKNEIDATISACLTGDKDSLMQAYNLRNGVRDNSEFSYLWAAYGIEFPSQMRHVPVLRGIFDSLVGMAIRRPFKYQVSCVNSDAVNEIFNHYRDSILQDFDQFWQNKIKAAVAVSKGDSADAAKAKDHLDAMQKKYKSGDFKSDLERLSKYMLDWATKRFKLQGFIPLFANDIVTAGQAHYQVRVNQIGKKPIIRVLNPLHLYYTKSTDTKWIKKCDRAVYKERLPVSIVWTLYGHKMIKKDQDRFLDNYGKYIVGSDIEIMDYVYGTLERSVDFTSSKGIEMPMIDVSDVEWKANTRVVMTEAEMDDDDSAIEGEVHDRIMKLKTRYKYKLDLFAGKRIGEDIYVDAGKVKDELVVRDPDDPSDVDLTFNGLCYNDRNGEPYSLVMKTKDIADKIDILHYHAENLLAMSGTKAIMVNMPDIPVWMGENEMQRAMKWLGMVKQGVGLVDMSQVGAGKFANMGDVDMSMSTAIISIFDMIDRLEATAYKVTGVSRQAVGSITQNDGKGTSEIAIQGTEVTTQPLFTTLDELMGEFMTDVANACRIAYSKGLQGSIILGNEGQKIFSIKKDELKLAFLNVFISGDGTEERDIDEIKALAHKYVDGQLLDIELGIDIVTLKSLSEIKSRVKESLATKKEDTTQQLSQELEQYKQQLDEANKMIEKLNTQDVETKQAELQIKKQDVDTRGQLKNKEIDQNAIMGAEKLRLEQKRIELEALQLEYGKGGNQEIRNN